ncbi:hypothetical protein [Desulfovibrio gilichinskyi]|uniref:TPM domain-containing protein n=1 Tax=Desulfovibrio gilichinskyi TaxID=1519643 RepID=A0A1X7E3W3_9BACT|nr:hypothetical protein [Desulfovibrio gilichinskyi]SMF26678.1 hypothetical protein SAMN06295933_2579 [Desulfovibrio gilichinskyi]
MILNFAPQGKTRQEKFLRFLGMIAVFIIVGWAFWQNNERTLEKLQGRNAIWDQTKTLSDADRQYIKGFIRSMRSEFGVKTKIHILNDQITEVVPEQNEMLITLSPAYEQVSLKIPGLVAHALGKKFIDDLEHNHFTGKFKNDTWPVALQTALAMIWQKLISVDNSLPSEYEQQDILQNGEARGKVDVPEPPAITQ